MADHQAENDGEVEVPIEAIQIIDPAVVEQLPPGTKVLSITPHGTSNWTRTARLDTENSGIKTPFFLKTTHKPLGHALTTAEHTSLTLLSTLTPSFVPRPLAAGTYTTNPSIHFLLSEFRHMSATLPPLSTFPAQLAHLHRSSQTHALNPGQFGFSIPTYHGRTPILHGWHGTWEGYFTETTRRLFELEQAAQGPNEEILGMLEAYFGKVVPRLLRPMETGGRRVRPSVLHGDLWHGNVGVDEATGEGVVFDAGCFWGHNEYELAVWRQSWNEIGEPYVKKYFEHMPKSEPQEDWDDRNALYATRVNILDSILYKKDGDYREELILGMRELIEKFGDGYEGWLAMRASD